MKTRLQLLHESETKSRYGIDRLEVDKVSTPREILDSQLNQELPAQGEGIHFHRRMNELKAKFGLAELSCEGLLGARLAENQKTLEQAMIEDARQKRGSMKLATASVKGESGKVHKFWFEYSL
jgi:hypothetical protein